MPAPGAKPAQPDPFRWVEERWEESALGESTGFLALGALLRAHTAVTASVDRTLRGHGASRTGYLILLTLHLADRGSRSHGQLARDLFVHATTISLVTDQLVASGLVRRAPDSADRRVTLSTITPKGRRLVVKATAGLSATGFGFEGEGGGDLDDVLAALRPYSITPPLPVPSRSRSRSLKTVAEGPADH